MKKIVLFLALGMNLAFGYDCSSEERDYDFALKMGFSDSRHCAGQSEEKCLRILKNRVERCYREQMLQ